ncbi:MAG: hypothetical protein AAF456_02990 [Planctomycetota bacterium]
MHHDYYRLLIVFFAMALSQSVVQADSLVFSNIFVDTGSIDGQSLIGQTATVTIDFQSGLVAEQSPFGGVVFVLGQPTSATYEFSEAGSFSVDVPESSLEFGSLTTGTQYELSLFNEDLSTLNMLSGTTAGNIGLDPLVGESLPAMFARLGDGTSISFTQAVDFQMLNQGIGSLNGGLSFVTHDIGGNSGSNVTLRLVSVPEPGSVLALSICSVWFLRRIRLQKRP